MFWGLFFWESGVGRKFFNLNAHGERGEGVIISALFDKMRTSFESFDEASNGSNYFGKVEQIITLLLGFVE